METEYLKEQQYIKIKKRVKEIKAFYIQLFLYIGIMPIIIITNLLFSPGFHFFWFALLGWGIGVFFHWLAVFGFKKIGFGKDWEEKKIKELLEEQYK
ncbi:MAG: 2TM domain-containing protein [Polaribacter sp.]